MDRERLILAFILLVLVPRSLLALDIAACGETVPKNTVGVLQADLDCSTHLFGVRLLRGATLDLNGHTIAGGDGTQATVLGVGSAAANNRIGRGRVGSRS